ncbi:MAG: hypothetical protein LAT55_00595 [Opitutales bacterium]|nr:hypothetical protein [Opitutales bacterium]
MKPQNKTVCALRILGLVGLLFFSACTSPRLERSVRDRPTGPEYELTNFFAVEALPPELRRVAVLPVFTGGNQMLDRERFESLLSGELRRAGHFEIVVLPEQTLVDLVDRVAMAPTEPFPKELVEYLQSRRVDGVLQVAVSEYSPYRPFVVGLSARLFTLSDGSVLWQVDELFRSSEKRTIVSARKYSLANRSSRFPENDSYAALRGPMLFSEFVLYTVVSSLPPPSGL